MANPDEMLNQLKKGLPVATGQWSNAWVSASGTYTIIKSTGGLLHTINIGMKSMPSLTAFDNASGMSGTMIACLGGGLNEGNYVYDLDFSSGLTIYTAVGVAPSIRIVYK